MQSLFEAENVTAPASLSEQAMLDKLNRSETEKHTLKMPRSKRKTFKSLVAVAACFAIIIGTGSGIYAVGRSGKAKPMENMTGVTYFTSYRQLRNTVREIDKKNQRNRVHWWLPAPKYDEIAADGEVEYGAADTPALSAPGTYGSTASQDSITGTAENTAEVPYAKTNQQVDAVDEADIIKTDGSYIYYIPSRFYYSGSRTIKIFSAKDGVTQLVSSTEVNGDVSLEEMYLMGDTLLAVGTHHPYSLTVDYGAEPVEDAEIAEEETLPDMETETASPDQSDVSEEENASSEATTVPITETTVAQSTETTTESTTASTPVSPELGEVTEECTIVLTYDISDRTAPVLTDTYEQSGSYLSSRVTGGTLYLVSFDGNAGRKVPVCGDSGSCERLPIENIVAVDGCNETNYAIIGAVDTADGANTQTKAVLGVGSDIYCNENNLYLFGNIYQYRDHYFDFTVDVQTQVVKYALDGTSVELVASARVDGTTDNQFSLDEKDGNLRIATTSTNAAFQDTNNLTVLDEGLNEIGKVTGFANNEHIEAVRYVGDTAYVITFERTDPLFIIDLSRPEKPAITGEVKIDGFSTFLTPVDDNTLLGIGYCTDEFENGGVYTDGLKLALFDVSDKKHPKVLDEASFPDAYSSAQTTHKALVRNSEKGYFAIPINVYDYYWEEEDGSEDKAKPYPYDNGILQFTLEDGSFHLKNWQANIETERCTFIGNYLYAVDADGNTIVSFPTE